MDTTSPVTLPRVMGEMALLLGLSRPAGQCFGVIWRAAQAPSADDLVAQLGLSRSNVSVALKELRQFGLIHAARSPGVRRDYFIADPDPWVLMRQILTERHRREFAPLADRLAELAPHDPRIEALSTVAEAASGWLAQMARLDPTALAQFMTESASKKKKKKKG